MTDARTVKRAVLGQWDHRGAGKGKLRGGTISDWRRLLGEANIDWTNVGNLAKDRKVWKSIVQARRTFLESWEEKICQWKRDTSAPNRSQRKKRETGPWLCRWEGCSTQCRTKTGLAQHERAHEKKTARLSCSQCQRVFARQCNLTNHAKICKGTSMNECLCGRTISEGNMTRHIRESCPLREHKIKPKRLNSLRVACPECSSLITSSKLSRHRKNLHGLQEKPLFISQKRRGRECTQQRANPLLFFRKVMNRSNRSYIAGRRRHVRFNLTETRKERLTRSLVNKGMLIGYARNPFRTIVRTALQPQYTMAVLGDSIAYGMFIRDAVVISCPGATLARMAVPEIREYIKSCGVKRLAILGGTNDLVARDGTVTPVEPILERLKRLIAAFKDEGIRVAVLQVPG